MSRIFLIYIFIYIMNIIFILKYKCELKKNNNRKLKFQDFLWNLFKWNFFKTNHFNAKKIKN